MLVVVSALKVGRAFPGFRADVLDCSCRNTGKVALAELSHPPGVTELVPQGWQLLRIDL